MGRETQRWKIEGEREKRLRERWGSKILRGRNLQNLGY